MNETKIWLKLDPQAARDSRLIEDVRSAAVGKEAPEVAFQILEKYMGAAGVDVLYDYAYGASATQSATLSARARNAVSRADVRSHASPALQVTLDLRTTNACEGKRALLARAREVGDARTLTVLKPLRAERGCGFANAKDCWPCLRKEGALNKTLQALEERVKGK